MSALANALATSLEFEGGLQMTWQPAPASAERSQGDNVDADTHVWIAVPGTTERAGLGVSLRRDAYLPFVIFLAAVLAAPIGWRRKSVCLLLGMPLVWFAAVLAVWVCVTHQLSQSPSSGATPLWRELVAFVFERGLTPPGNRVIVPLLFAGSLISTSLSRASQSGRPSHRETPAVASRRWRPSSPGRGKNQARRGGRTSVTELG